MAFSVTFWGVRGTIPCPAQSHMEFGGNTSCVELRINDRIVILDAGTGLRLLGKRLLAEGAHSATLLLSHTHLDHISGFPFFGPAFQPGFELRVVAGHLDGGGIGSVLARQMERPLFPVPMRTMGCALSFIDLAAHGRLDLGDGIEVRTAPLNHPDGATGYRVSDGRHSVAYVTDTEHMAGKLDERILDLVRGVDLFLYDSTYTDDEYAQKTGWGHSTWREGVRLARAAGVKKLVLFHHEPDHEDVIMRRIEAEARAEFPSSLAAREGATIVLS